MQYIVLFFGFLLFVAGLVLVFRPDVIFGFLDRNKSSLGIHVFGVLVRLVLGAALIVYADQARFPLTFQVLGWITIVAAFVLTLMGRSNFKRLMNWAMGLGNAFGRVAGIVAMVFGAFLAYAVY